jgi:hypothetical protein
MTWTCLLRGTFGVLVIAMALASITPREAVAAEERRSGTVVAVDRSSSTLLLRVGPWRPGEPDATAPNPERIALTPETSIVLAEHPGNASTWTAVKVSSETEPLRPGAFATVIFTETATEWVAKRIEVIADPSRAARETLAPPSSLTIRPK